MKYGLLAVAAAWILSGCTVQVSGSFTDDCKFQEEHTATIPVGAVKNLSVIADSGSLRVEGRPGLTEVRVQGTACASSENLLSQVDLRTENAGDVVRVQAIVPSVTFGNSPRLDLIIEVPDTMLASIQDESGDIQVQRVAGVVVKDDSGSIDLIEITGPIRITDDSGDIEIRDASGKVVIEEDQSGNIRIDGVKGDVQIDRDDSGDIDITEVTGSVTIDEDNSGNIQILDITGNVLISEDDSGSIDVNRVQGDFTVRRDGSGNIHYSNVGGQTTVPRK
ncbi:MAG: hypothetical protein K0R39_1648 [Symbiobacteriaceae bacterium]|jgi:hypothetical protein|nr:hypothetical protein [Symbiobacteriaceae bacterium]